MTTQNAKTTIACDVAVVGGGNAGLSAAIEAANRGARVVLIEKGPKATRGGNSRFTYGDFRVITPGTKPILDLLDECPFPREQVEIEELTADFFCGEAMRLSEGLGDRKLTQLFVDKSYDAVVWMKEQGVRWTLNPVLAFQKDGRAFYPNGNANIQAIGAGPGLVEMMYAIAEKKGVTCLYEAAAYELLVGADGGVTGVLARGPEGIIRVDARGVILCCGGFQASAEKRRRYLGENMDLVLLRGSKNNTGDWIEMTQAVNAQLVGHWGGCHASPVSQDLSMVMGAHVTAQRYSFPYGIMVNRRGERFVDEGENFYCWTYNRYGKDILRQPGSVAWQIFDGRSYPVVTYKDAAKTEAGTLEELAAKAGFDPAGFARTVKEFNAAIVNDEKPYVPYELDGRRTRGLTPEKTNWAQKIDTPPYRAFAVICGLTMTYGGMKVDEKARVIDTADRPVKGLYAVGEATGGYFYHTYLGGSGLIRGVVMGRIAAADAYANR
jgi:tricarballylate dehydrogenase